MQFALSIISRMPMINGVTNWNQLYEHHMDWHDNPKVWTSPTSRPNSPWAEFWQEFCHDQLWHQIVESSLSQSPSPDARTHGHHTTHTALWQSQATLAPHEIVDCKRASWLANVPHKVDKLCHAHAGDRVAGSIGKIVADQICIRGWSQFKCGIDTWDQRVAK